MGLFGLFYGLYVGGSVAIDSVKKTSWNEARKEVAIKNGKIVYTDYNGIQRLVKDDMMVWWTKSGYVNQYGVQVINFENMDLASKYRAEQNGDFVWQDHYHNYHLTKNGRRVYKAKPPLNGWVDSRGELIIDLDKLEVKKCPNCGEAIVGTGGFCRKCGVKRNG